MDYAKEGKSVGFDEKLSPDSDSIVLAIEELAMLKPDGKEIEIEPWNTSMIA